MKKIERNIIGHGYETLYRFGHKHNCLKEIKEVFNADTLSKLIRNIANFPNKVNVEDYEKGKPLEESSNKIKGDLWELFCIIWLEANGGDRSYRITNVKWADRDQRGVDFYATDTFGKQATIQAKFHANPIEKYKADQLETFLLESHEVYTRILFTSAAKVDGRYMISDSQKQLVVINKKAIKKFYDKGFVKSLVETTNKLF